MGEMMERIARAILIEAAQQIGGEIVNGNVTVTMDGEISFSTGKLARAAVEAMREPSEAMMRAAGSHDVGLAYDNMLAFVLTEGGRTGEGEQQ